MSKCFFFVEKTCGLGLFKGRPGESDCNSCNQYQGEPRGLGDKIHKVLQSTGVDAAAKAISKTTGKPCRCGKRRASLNKMFPSKD